MIWLLFRVVRNIHLSDTALEVLSTLAKRPDSCSNTDFNGNNNIDDILLNMRQCARGLFLICALTNLEGKRGRGFFESLTGHANLRNILDLKQKSQANTVAESLNSLRRISVRVM